MDLTPEESHGFKYGRFAIGLRDLCSSAPSVRERFVEMRDSRVIDDESTSNERCDWLAENDIISENERTIGWYSSVSARLRPSGILKWYLRKITKTLLIANQQWILASTLTGDPIVEFSEV